GPAEVEKKGDVGWTKNTECGFIDGTSSNYSSTLHISGTEEDVIFQSDQYEQVTYKVRLPHGNYDVKLLFAEKYFNSSGSRVFDVYFEQNRVIENLDIYQSVGRDAALVKEITNVEVSDGVLDIQFAEKVDNALLCGIV